MQKLVSSLLLSIIILLNNASCKKCKEEVDTCTYDACDTRRKTVATASEWTGQSSYYNDLRKWAINYHLPGTYDSIWTCIICVDINDTLKTIGKVIIFSGDIKEGCGNPAPTFHGQEIFYITPTKLR